MIFIFLRFILNMNKIIGILESNYYLTSFITMKIIELNDIDISLNSIFKYLVYNEYINNINVITIMGADVLKFKYRKRDCDIMTLNNKIIITIYPLIN
jgi:hypothetical protein